jgi:formylglycine-generating enzyme required for sulfatase activity
MEPTRGAEWRVRGVALSLAWLLTLGSALLALLPAAALAREGGGDSHFRATPVERALTGGLVTLRERGSPMVRVPSSTFEMGSNQDDVIGALELCALEPLGQRCNETTFADELPRRRVRLPSYFLDRTEVTVADYRRCALRGRCPSPTFEAGAQRFDRRELPMVMVNAADAEAFCRARGARLPSEAEFERAARGSAGRRFPWGELYNSRLANHGRLGLDPTDARDGYVELAPVGSFPSGRTPDGFLDLAGNVAEWTQAELGADQPASASSSGRRFVRGGSFVTGAAFLRGAARSAVEPETRAPFIGFRCALSDGPEPPKNRTAPRPAGALP